MYYLTRSGTSILESLNYFLLIELTLYYLFLDRDYFLFKDKFCWQQCLHISFRLKFYSISI